SPMRIPTLAMSGLLLLGAAGASPDSRSVKTKDGVSLKVEIFVDGLDVPWSLAFTSPARMLVTERPGRVRVVENGVLRKAPLGVIADVESRGETGLMGLTLAPDYPASRLIYLSYVYTVTGGIRVRVVRFRDDGSGLSDRKVILEGLPAAQFHAGCRLRFGPDGKLYVTTGDATTGEIAQKMGSLGGKTLRLNPDGSIPADNPFPGSPIYSLGHRNSQGLDWQPGTGLQFQTEHGPSGFDGPGGGDEVNIVEAGKNYGWPVVHHKESKEGMVSPLLEFTPAIAPSGASFVTGSRVPALRGDFLFACLRGERLMRVRLDPKDPRHVLATEALFDHEFGRLREVQNGPDGAIYFTTSNRDGRGSVHPGDDRVLRLTQAPN
ncbi:MAG TPA: PQQ-dependent sugar dehydrogenase, partial [Thermoanaerobaculia bacterium]|nr:PQQ-dependent sugar dehydrogenase [Thermoanaerobaculia bacterium]